MLKIIKATFISWAYANVFPWTLIKNMNMKLSIEQMQQMEWWLLENKGKAKLLLW